MILKSLSRERSPLGKEEEQRERGVKKKIYVYKPIQTWILLHLSVPQRGNAGAGNQVKSRRACSSQGESTGL